jgi:hypothetical protein
MEMLELIEMIAAELCDGSHPNESVDHFECLDKAIDIIGYTAEFIAGRFAENCFINSHQKDDDLAEASPCIECEPLINDIRFITSG